MILLSFLCGCLLFNFFFIFSNLLITYVFWFHLFFKIFCLLWILWGPRSNNELGSVDIWPPRGCSTNVYFLNKWYRKLVSTFHTYILVNNYQNSVLSLELGTVWMKRGSKHPFFSNDAQRLFESCLYRLWFEVRPSEGAHNLDYKDK